AQNAQQGRLARPIATHETDALLCFQNKIGMIQQGHVPERQLRIQQGHQSHKPRSFYYLVRCPPADKGPMPVPGHPSRALSMVPGKSRRETTKIHVYLPLRFELTFSRRQVDETKSRQKVDGS